MSGNTSHWQSRTVLVTGAGGFIGSTLVDILVRRGASVRAFVRYNSRDDHAHIEDLDRDIRAEVDVYSGDLQNPEAVAGAVAGRDVVLHLGALIPIPYSYRHPREYVFANIDGTINVLEACRQRDVSRVVQVSSSEVYGTAQTVPIDESHPLNPQSPYAATKVGADQLALTYQRSFGTPVVLARPFNTFGPRQSQRAVIPTIITQALTRDRVELGALSPTRDFTFVEDTASAIAACGVASEVEGETFNFGTGEEHAVGDVATRILELLGAKLPVVATDERRRPPASEVARLVADASKARARLGWMPATDFETGLERTIEWVSRSLERFRPAIYTI
ncbi:MAG: GDP-mannose 4,6-dehydratase [Gaiella sp.]|nr:GDP-mannose 4,6-dehydratase [Gaiella sp.]